VKPLVVTACLHVCLPVSAFCQAKSEGSNARIIVNANEVLADLSSHPLGVNASWMLDSDARLGAGAIPFAKAMVSWVGPLAATL
jgi:hypothetical protein